MDNEETQIKIFRDLPFFTLCSSYDSDECFLFSGRLDYRDFTGILPSDEVLSQLINLSLINTWKPNHFTLTGSSASGGQAAILSRL